MGRNDKGPGENVHSNHNFKIIAQVTMINQKRINITNQEYAHKERERAEGKALHKPCVCECNCCRVTYLSHLRWLNTVFETYVSFAFFSKTFDPLVTKMEAGKFTVRFFDS